MYIHSYCDFLLVILFNVNDLRQNLKRKSIFYHLKNKKFGIILLQETHSSIGDETLWQYEWGGKIIFAHGNSNSKGTAILIRQSFACEVKATYADSSGRFLLTEIKINDENLVYFNVYAPNKDDSNFFDTFFTEVSNFLNANLIFGEDWNLVLNNLLDKDGGPPHANRKSKKRLKSYIDFFNLADIFCITYPMKKVYKRFQSQPYTATRIDFLISNSLVSNVNSTKINQSIRCDQKIVSLIKCH